MWHRYILQFTLGDNFHLCKQKQSQTQYILTRQDNVVLCGVFMQHNVQSIMSQYHTTRKTDVI